ncbi:hypothetical protein [Pseudonocardia sp. MH-G8]|uniref:hypothetical protein n=1 Tax=Pseudonocardia sp. MH-G8 TaxID=1854588 RepID=UPI00117B7151|nr:hypothetical protein [Pseudonocardia sp. MH-G8]
MTFFELPPTGTSHDQSEDAPEDDRWTAPPRGVLPAVVPLEITAHHEDLAAIYLRHANVYPIGCSFWLTVAARLHTPDSTRERMVSEAVFADTVELRQLATLDDALARFGVAYIDGSRATTLENPSVEAGRDPTDKSRAPLLVHYEHNANVGDLFWQGEHELWLSPLPPAEHFELLLEWPRLEVPLTRVIIDGHTLADAAERSRHIWPS